MNEWTFIIIIASQVNGYFSLQDIKLSDFNFYPGEQDHSIGNYLIELFYSCLKGYQ